VTEELGTLLAKQAITEVLYRYCHAVDRIDPELGAAIWHEDGLAHYEGIFEGTGAGFIDFVFEQHRNCDATSHQLTNMLIEVDGERAGSESYVTACIRSSGVDVVVRGRYLDSWSRRQGRWRIDERRYTTDIMQITPVGGQEVPAGDSAS
jgi:SnoaL-like domain